MRPGAARLSAWGANRREVAADAIARACNADSSSKFHGVPRIYLTLGDLADLHALYVVDVVEAVAS